ncbi:MAG: CoA-binding protein [Deltaproteobacteria bacterium]|nr:CoA-binding protein [Deltaproteobacteria bacterium]MBI3077624.1 CoA-binding protein [Deltaproteobacteria bacterium]
MAILATPDCRVLVQGITGREAAMVTHHCLAYGSPILAGVSPGKGGQALHGVPIYDTVREACEAHGINTSVVYVPPAFALDAGLEAIANGIKLLLVMTERVPVHDVVRLLQVAAREGCTVVGPNSVGIISPGARIKLGAIGGDNPARCFVPGPVGVISRSGGMTAEVSWMVKRAGYGVSTSVSIGGDAIIGSTPREILARFEADPETRAVVLWGEPGTAHEEEAAEFLAQGGFTKPLIAYVAGKFMEEMPEGTVFGHGASLIQAGRGRPSAKLEALRKAGGHTLERFNDLLPVLREVLGD